MNALSPQISQMKQYRNSLIDWLSSKLPSNALANPPGMMVTDPGTWQGAGNALMQFAIPQPEDTMMGLMKPSLNAAIRLKNGSIIDTGRIHLVPENINTDDIIDMGFIDLKSGKYLTRNEASLMNPDYPTLVEQGKLHSSDIGKQVPWRLTKDQWSNLYKNNMPLEDFNRIHERSVADAIKKGYKILE